MFHFISSTSERTHLIESSHRQASLRGKKTLFKSKIGDCDQKNWSDLKKFDIITSPSATFFLKVGVLFSLKVTIKACFSIIKTHLKFRLLRYLSKTKKEECNEKDWRVCHRFGIIKPFSATYFLEVDAQVSLKVAIKGFIRGKKNSEDLDL